MAIRQRQRGRPQGRSNSFQRRLTWREVETAFNYLFDVGLDNDEAERIVLRFRRARSQLLPLFSGMVVSPYEQERLVALTCLGKMGGATTAKMLDDVLADIDVHEAFKRDVRQLRETISPEPQPDEEGDEELEEVDTELGVEGEDEDELEFEPAAETDATEAEAETTAESEPTTEEAREPSRSRRRSRGRGRRREPQEQAPPPVTIDPNVFEAAPEAFLTALDGPIEPLLTAFAELPLPKRLSFIDRSGRLDDARVLRFLVPLLETEEWALVQSALRAIQTLGRVEALEVVERLAADSGRKRVKLRAERVRDHLRELAAAAPPAPAEPQPEPESQPAPPRSGRGRPRPLRGGRSRDEADLPAQQAAASFDWGLQAATPPVPRPAATTPLMAPAKLPKLVVCLASGIGPSGRQLLRVYRQGDDGLQRLDAEIEEQFGWVGMALAAGLPANQHRLDQEQAAEAGTALAEVTVGYVRRRLQDALEQNSALDRPAPNDAQAALTWVGSGRRTELAAEAPETPLAIDQQGIERLLDHGLFEGWALALRADGEAMVRWLGTSGRRSASRIRRRLIDDVLEAWLATGDWQQLPDRLRRQALLLERLGERELAELAASVAETLANSSRPSEDLLLRELVYRGFQARLPAAQAGAERAARHGLLATARQRHARSAFRRGLRKR